MPSHDPARSPEDRPNTQRLIVSEWLTYAQAGARFGLTPDAMRMRARRLGWRSQPGNDGKTLIMVPDDAALQPRERADEGSAERAPEQTAPFARLTELIVTADARAERAESRADRAEQRA